MQAMTRHLGVLRSALLLAGLCLLAGTGLHAQDTGTAADRAAVRRAVLDYVEGFYEGDADKLTRSISPGVYKYGYGLRGQEYVGMQMRFPAGFLGFAQGVREGRNRPPANAPREIVLFEVQDQTASAKLTAWWGTDYLLLGKQDGRWMITHVTWQSPPPRA